MSTIRTDFFRTLVNQSYEDIFYEKSNYYFFLGKVDPWETDPDDTNLKLPEYSSFPRNSQYDRTIRDNILYLSKIRPTDSSIVARRIVWESGKVFDQWDHRVEMEGKDFYCFNSNLNVYKCLYNSNGLPSTVEPDLRSVEPFRTSDGYLWKYMYTISPTKAEKFLYDVHMPVQKALTDTFYNNGAIEEVRVVEPGSNYNNDQLTSIQVSDTTTGSGAAGEITSVSSNGEIESVSVTSSGIDYTSGARVVVESSTGVGAVIEPVIDSDGSIADLDIVNSGGGYQVSDTVNITVGGAVLVPAVSPSSGTIVSVDIEDSGIGYSSDPTLTVLPESPGEGIYGNTDAVLKAHVFEGSIVNVTIEDPGENYPADSETILSVSGNGDGARFVPVIDESDGSIVSVSVENPGKNYTYAVIDVIGPGSGARVEPIIKGSDIDSDQPIIEQTAVEGAIHAVQVTNPGTNYSDSTEITIDGDGTGAVGEAVIDDGQVKEILMTEAGSGYSYATVRIDDPLRDSTVEGSVEASAYAILPPINGHGNNAVEELFGRTLGLYVVIQQDEILESIDQEYRQYGVVKDPREIGSNQKIESNVSLTVFEVDLSTTNGLEPDEILINNSIRYRVITINGSRVRLQQLSAIYRIPSSTFVKEADQSQEYTLTRLITTPNVDKYSGELLYSTNRSYFQPKPDRSLTVRTYLEFKTV